MTQASTTAKEKNLQQAPPEERFWVRYSPHHELPLSGLSSLAIHVVVFLLVIVAGALAYWFRWSDKDKSLPVEAVTWDKGGGGGSPGGIGDAPGTRNPGEPEAVDRQPLDPNKPPEAPKREKLESPEASPLRLPEVKDPNVRRLIEAGNEAVASIAALNEGTRARLSKGLRSGQGQGGGGSDGGKDRGKDKGKDGGVGQGSGTLTQREKRVLRWTMVFNTLDGQDYRRQLHGLGAILAIPEPNQPNQYRVIRDLMKPNPQPEDLSDIRRIYWVDNKAQSVEGLARALGVRFPGHFVAFFPESLEQKLLKMELTHARGRTEDDIQETKFVIRRVGTTYEPQIVEQKYLR